MQNIEGFNIDVQFKNVRALRLSVKPDATLRLTVPYGMNKGNVARFVREHRHWIIEKTAQVKERMKNQQMHEEHQCTEGEIFTYLGQDYPLHIVYKNQPVSVKLTDDALILICPQRLSIRARLAAINAWYARQLRAIVDKILTYYLAAMQEQPIRELRFKRMISRWGSCKPCERIVCLNVRLIFYPFHTIEAVVVHELVHLKEQSHNARFHSLMHLYLPQYKEYEQALRK